MYQGAKQGEERASKASFGPSKPRSAPRLAPGNSVFVQFDLFGYGRTRKEGGDERARVKKAEGDRMDGHEKRKEEGGIFPFSFPFCFVRRGGRGVVKAEKPCLLTSWVMV